MVPSLPRICYGTVSVARTFKAEVRYRLCVLLVMQVIQQLEEPDAKMAHCKLGFDGAKALAAALAVAVHIRALDLRDNGLDGKVC